MGIIANTSAFSAASNKAVAGTGTTTAESPTNVKNDPKVLTGRTQFEPNILTQYDNPTYNFRLFITKENAEHRDISNEDILVIAETGSTGFNIQDVNIATTISPGRVAKNTTAEQIKFKILEPHGNRLFDQIRNAAAELRVFDHRTAPLWLQLTFKGYTTDSFDSYEGGFPSESVENDDLNNISYLWKIKVTDVQIEIDKGGTVYAFTATPSAHTGLKDDARRIEKDERIEANTLGEYFTKLADRLNHYDNYSIQSNQDITKRIRRYAFAFPDGKTIGKDTSSAEKNQTPSSAPKKAPNSGDMKNWIINNRSDDKYNTKRNKDSFAGTIVQAGDQKAITFSKGTPIEVIIQEVIGATMEGQSLAIHGVKNRSTSDAGEDSSIRDAATPAILFMVDPLVDYLSYNRVANLYNLLITYHVKPYKTFKPLINRKQIEEYQGKDSKKRLNAILQVANVKKRYDYIFTGLNTEVLDYKIHFQNAWFVPLPIFQGQNNPGTAASAEKNPKERKNDQILQEITKAAEDSDQSIITKTIGDLANEELKKQRILLFSRLGQTEEGSTVNLKIVRALTQLDKEINARRNQQVNLGSGRVGTSRFGSSNTTIRLTNDVRPPSTTPVKAETTGFVIGAKNERKDIADRKRKSKTVNGSGSIYFIEDTESLSVAQKSASDLNKEQKKEIVSVSTEPGPTTVPYTGNIDTTASKGRSYFSAIMNQMYGSMSDMVELDLTIRGDPYWLGEPDPQKRITRAATGSRDLTNSDVFILMRFGFPNGFDDGGPENNIDSYAGTGLADIQTIENGFNGMYRVVRVINEFSGGKFTQKLEGNIDPVTREQDVIQILTRDSI